MDMDVGQRLKSVRLSTGLSQRQLAIRANVTNGMISMIEKNSTSPSIASLKKILQAIPMSLSEFFNVEEVAGEKYFYKADELKEISPSLISDLGAHVDANTVSFRQVGDAKQHSIQMLYERYQPGADTGDEPYSHESEEIGIVISGEIEITVGEQIQALKTGDAYLFDSRIPHRFRNPGNEECIIVSACTPPTF